MFFFLASRDRYFGLLRWLELLLFCTFILALAKQQMQSVYSRRINEATLPGRLARLERHQRDFCAQ